MRPLKNRGTALPGGVSNAKNRAEARCHGVFQRPQIQAGTKREARRSAQSRISLRRKGRIRDCAGRYPSRTVPAWDFRNWTFGKLRAQPPPVIHVSHPCSDNLVDNSCMKKIVWPLHTRTADATDVVDGKSDKIALVSTVHADYF